MEKAVTVQKSSLDVEQSSTAVGMVICWRDPGGGGHGLWSDRRYGDLLPPELTKPPQPPLRGNLTLVASVSSSIVGICQHQRYKDRANENKRDRALVRVSVGRRASNGGREMNIDQTVRKKNPRGAEICKLWKWPGTMLCPSANVK